MEKMQALHYFTPIIQIITTSIVPQHRGCQEEAQRYYDDWRSCIYCEILEF